jgi:hypothetical protein
MGMARPENIRQTIEKYAEDLSDFGILTRRVKNHGGGRGPPRVRKAPARLYKAGCWASR